MPLNDRIYTVYEDDRPIHRGWTYQAAWKFADAKAKERDRKNASSKQRTPCIEVRIDQDLVKQDDALYRYFRQQGGY